MRQRGRVNFRIKERLLLNAPALCSALGVAITEEQAETAKKRRSAENRRISHVTNIMLKIKKRFAQE